jgi:hypothetical protein
MAAAGCQEATAGGDSRLRLGAPHWQMKPAHNAMQCKVAGLGRYAAGMTGDAALPAPISQLSTPCAEGTPVRGQDYNTCVAFQPHSPRRQSKFHLQPIQQRGVQRAARVGVGVQPGVQVAEYFPPQRHPRLNVAPRHGLHTPAAAARHQRPGQPAVEKPKPPGTLKRHGRIWTGIRTGVLDRPHRSQSWVFMGHSLLDDDMPVSMLQRCCLRCRPAALGCCVRLRGRRQLRRQVRDAQDASLRLAVTYSRHQYVCIKCFPSVKLKHL